MLEISYKWTSTGSSGGLSPVRLAAGALESVLYVQFSTLATTNSISFQTAPNSSGPWVNEATASLSTAVSSAAAIRVTGAYEWMRPYIHTASTGAYTFRLVATS